MGCAKAVIFDYIGTLVECGGYTMEASRDKLYSTLVNEGFDVSKDKFLEATFWRMRNTAKYGMNS